MSSFNWQSIKNDFPILDNSRREKPLVYLDNAATTQKPLAVIDKVDEYYKNYNANVHRGVHSLSVKATDAYEGARETVRDFINARSVRELIFVRGTTEAINLVASSYGGSKIKQGDEIIVSEMEHHSNIVPWQLLAERAGAKIKVIPINDHGELDLNNFPAMFSDKTKILAVGHISNALGTINPIKDMIKEAHKHNVPVIIDGAQAIPHSKVDVQDLDCDFYAFSGHKAYGPTGIGVLYAKEALLEAMPPYQGGGEMILRVSFDDTQFNDIPAKFEAGTPNIAGAIGMAAGLEYINNIGLDAIATYEHELLEYALERAADHPQLKLVGTAKHKASILSFLYDGVHAHDIGTILDCEGVAIRTGHHCAMPVMDHFGVPATARASFAFYNSRADIDALFKALDRVKEVFKL